MHIYLVSSTETSALNLEHAVPIELDRSLLEITLGFERKQQIKNEADQKKVFGAIEKAEEKTQAKNNNNLCSKCKETRSKRFYKENEAFGSDRNFYSVSRYRIFDAAMKPTKPTSNPTRN